ncbi:cytochrome-c peroxidase [Cupriavidus basilensis OR16]|uniref:Cytochrome-c peroxidase n=1 Tax=Cupriavidus basilensis OR16 TaxID=1127483 RepID=H1S026_9BURK|nr:cytochrome c peroxidase [Cupriavidus basilensis]EHP44242.1 cytochrome-c peroxidase [Cupriavidus basilensis OR16]
MTESDLHCIAIAWVVGLSTSAFAGQLQERLGLPPVRSPVDNVLTDTKADLGKKLFLDKRLSADGSVSCASCHQPDRAFSDGLKTSRGVGDRAGTRNAPSLLTAGLMESQFWDGRRASLEDQALDPFVNPKEHGLSSHDQLLSTIRHDSDYPELFRQAFDVSTDSIEKRHVAKALASYLRSIVAGNSAFDRFYYAGDQTALLPAARRGLTLFTGRAQCSTCHHVGKSSAAFTDNQFHSLHIGLDRIERRLAGITKEAVAARRDGRSVDATVLTDDDIAELGRFFITLDPADIGKFRTPSLRNVALTAPYMHDGSVPTLEQAVEHEIYYRTAQNGRPLILTPAEKVELTVFLRSLTSETAHRIDSP